MATPGLAGQTQSIVVYHAPAHDARFMSRTPVMVAHDFPE